MEKSIYLYFIVHIFFFPVNLVDYENSIFDIKLNSASFSHTLNNKIYSIDSTETSLVTNDELSITTALVLINTICITGEKLIKYF